MNPSLAPLAGAAALVLLAACNAPASTPQPRPGDAMHAADRAAYGAAPLLVADTTSGERDRDASRAAVQGMGIRPTGSTANGITP